MKCLVIHGSPRKGNTYRITKEAMKELEEIGNVDFDQIYLKDENIPFCTGCLSCVLNGEETCPHSDIIQPLLNKMKEADCLIVTSPVYIMNVSALLKNFFDHLPFLFHRPYFFKKTALIITTTAGSGHKEVIKYVKESLTYFGYNKCYSLGFRGNSTEPPLKEKTISEISDVVSDFYKSVKNQPSSPSIYSLNVYSLWRSMANIGFISKDKEYWTKEGILNSDYPEGVPLPGIKRVLAKILFKFYTKLFSKRIESQ